ncbi:MAG TPA: Sir2 family NAD+-dependent deacetylase [Holophaga sp.]|nr:Sir2 family NAD+-dependent deacetylase [Holophaga sp.]
MPAALRSDPLIVVLTGAGISAESGLRTFRAADGLWEDHRVEDVATPEGFARDPALVQRFYNERRRQLGQVEPNAAHHALARLEREWPGDFLLVTQNVDDLHDRAGSRNLIHMHGELLKARCLRCGQVAAWAEDIAPRSACPACGRTGSLRPHIVWFGEMPLELDRIGEALDRCAVFAAIGTSGNVYPAAGFVSMAAPGAHTVELNLDASLVSTAFRECRQGRATELVPQWVDELLD